jgi:hypothetical protein
MAGVRHPMNPDAKNHTGEVLIIRKRRKTMEDKVIVLNKEGDWLELENCFLVGAAEHPDKVVYYKFIFCKCAKDTRDEILKRAEQYLVELKKERSGVVV